MTFTTFTPNCTLPTVSVDYVASVPVRSTLDIVWGSLSTIIACTYTVLHLDVIADGSITSRKSAWWPDTRRALRNFAVELSMAGVAVLAPEYILCLAILNLLDARSWRQFQGADSGRWTTTHLQYGNMGGFRLCRESKNTGSRQGEPASEEILLNLDCIAYAIRCGALPPQPPISETEINDHSKASVFGKPLAMWQMIWFGVNVVTRLARDLPLSQLEVGTAAFVLISTVTWGCYFTKPKGVQSGTRLFFTLPVDPIDPEDDTSAETSSRNGVQQESEASLDLRLARELQMLKNSQNDRMGSIYHELIAQLTQNSEDANVIAGLVLAGAAMVAIPFGVVHIAAWNAAFPTSLDRWLWRASALTITLPATVPIALMGIFLGLDFIQQVSPRLKDRVERAKEMIQRVRQSYHWTVGWIAFLVLYILARMILLAEMVRCMSHLPPEAYVATWTENLPYLG